jgi:hypothetical protein
MGCPALPPANTEDLTPEEVTPEEVTPEEDLTPEEVEFRILAGSCAADACAVCGVIGYTTTTLRLGITPWNASVPICVNICGECHKGPVKMFLDTRTAEQPAGFGYRPKVVDVNATDSQSVWTISTEVAWRSNDGKMCVSIFSVEGDRSTTHVLPLDDLVTKYIPV